MVNDLSEAGPPDLEVKGRPLRGVGGEKVSGEMILWDGPISFLGDVDPSTGRISREGLETNLKDRVLVFREGAGSTVGSYVVYNLGLNGKAPKAMVMEKADAIITMGCIMADIPLVHRVSGEIWERFRSGDLIEVDPAQGTLKIWTRIGPDLNG